MKVDSRKEPYKSGYAEDYIESLSGVVSDTDNSNIGGLTSNLART